MTSVAQKPQGVSTYNWETGETTFDVTQMNAGQKFRCAISQATEAARRRFPHSNDRIERAFELVHAAKVVLHPATKTATVTSSDGAKAYTVHGVCECPDASTKAPEGYCKHHLAVLILKKALEIMKAFGTATAPVTLPAEKLATEEEETPVETIPTIPQVQTAVRHLDMATWPTVEPVTAEPVTEVVEPAPAVSEPAPVLEAEVVPSFPRIPREFLYERQGHTAILFGGLLHMAHQQGLLSLSEAVTHVADSYVLAEARAEFHDGRVFRGIGDSTPDNVGKLVKLHWRRMAGTRAKARALRDALNIPYVCSVELDD